MNNQEGLAVATYGWRELRSRAAVFAKRWAGESHERAEKDTFWNQFLEIFGIDRRQVARFEAVARRYSTKNHGFIDVFWPGRILVEHKSLGENLVSAMWQAEDYLPGMDEDDVPRLVVVCDFEHFRVRDLDTGQTVAFTLEELPQNLDVFGILAGRDSRSHQSEVDVNLHATALLARFHDALKDSYDDHYRRVLLTRILFFLFADDAGVWPPGLFEDFLRLRTRQDGEDLGSQLAWLFQLLNTPESRRSASIPEEAQDFTYINGGVFKEVLPIADCNREMRNALLAASRFNWSRISPAIFGSMFQNVMQPKERRKLGAHYTTEENILRTIKPLFLDRLSAELDSAGRNKARLRAFRDRLASLTFFDPACGCGNFLVITYREIRKLETECIVRLRDAEGMLKRDAVSEGQLSIDATLESKVTVNQFYGIEIEEFPCQIAATALHLTDHLANLELGDAVGSVYVRFPIEQSAHVHHANALEVPWESVLPASECDYILGNPPFVGKKERTPEQKAERDEVFKQVRGSGVIDYVGCWYLLSAQYMKGTSIRAGLVSTNSITQGEQVPVLWKLLLDMGIRIQYAYRTFAWESEAKGKAHVHVVIIGFTYLPDETRSLWDKPTDEPTKVASITPYLREGPPVVVLKRRKPFADWVKPAVEGSKLGDWGLLTVEQEDIDTFRADPIAGKFLRPLVGSKEVIQGEDRWCLWLKDAEPAELRSSLLIRGRLSELRDKRHESTKTSTFDMGDRPTEFLETRQPSGDYLLIPCVSSQSRNFLPTKFCTEDQIIRGPHSAVQGANEVTFGFVSSSFFMAWIRTVSGRFKSDYQVTPGVVYNTFPYPPSLSAADESSITKAAREILDTREKYPSSTLADLYEPTVTPAPLVEAHRKLDRVIDRIYEVSRATEAKRLACLFELYGEYIKSA